MDDGVPVHGDSHASSPHEASLEPTCWRREDLGKQCFFSFPQRPKLRDLSEDRNYKAPCRRRIGGAIPRAENFGDLITAAKAGYDCLNNATVENRPEAVGWAPLVWQTRWPPPFGDCGSVVSCHRAKVDSAGKRRPGEPIK